MHGSEAALILASPDGAVDPPIATSCQDAELLQSAGKMPAGPTAKMAVLQRGSSCDLIGRESRLRNSCSDVGILADPLIDAADLVPELPPFCFFFVGISCYL